MSGWKNAIPFFLMGTLPAAMLLLHGYIGSFTRYIADDYCSAFYAQRFGLFRSVWHWYTTWSGRFSAYASDWFVTSMGARNVRIVPPIVLAIWLIVTVLAVRFALRRFLRREEVLWVSSMLSIVFIFAVLLLSPNIQQSFYWWNGMRSYNLPLVMLTLFAALYQWLIEKTKTGKAIIAGSVFSFLFLFANAGLGDVFAVSQFSLLVVLIPPLIKNPKRREASLAIFLAGLLGTALAILAIILAPGNAHREAFFPPHPGPLKLLTISSQGYTDFLQSMANAPEKVFGLAGAILVAIWAGSLSHERSNIEPGRIITFILLGLLLSLVSFLPASYGLSQPPPTRNLMVPVFALIANLLIAAFIAGNQFSLAANSKTASLALAVLAVLAINLSAGINIYRSYQNRDLYTTFAKNWDAAEAQILEAKASGQTSVTVPAWPNWAGLDFLSDNPKNWLNTCESGYYGIEVIGKRP